MTYEISEEVLAVWADEIGFCMERISAMLDDVDRISANSSSSNLDAAKIHTHCVMAASELDTLYTISNRIGNFKGSSKLPIPAVFLQ